MYKLPVDKLIANLVPWQSVYLKAISRKVRRRKAPPISKNIICHNSKYVGKKLVNIYSLNLKSLPYVNKPILSFRKFSFLSMVNHFYNKLDPDRDLPPMRSSCIRKLIGYTRRLIGRSDIRNIHVGLKGRIKGMDRKEKTTSMVTNPSVERIHVLKLKNTFSIPKYGTVGVSLIMSTSTDFTKILKL